jgi:hypothetical protein
MADTFTTNLNLTKPEPGAAEDTWGISLNSDLDTLDAIFSSSGTQVNLNPNQVNFADNKKAIFGTGSDLQIYHDGSASYIDDTGTGPLYLKGNAITAVNLSDVVMFTAIGGNKVGLNYNGNEKLATTTSGIDVTGDITASGNIDINSDSGQLQFGADNDMQIFHNGTNGEINISTGNFTIDTNGTITLNADQSGRVLLSDGTTNYGRFQKGGTSWNFHGLVQNNSFRFLGNDGGTETEVMRIQYDGLVGIGTSSPNSILEVLQTVTNGDGASLRIINDGSGIGTGQTASLVIGRNFEERNFKIQSSSTLNYGSKPDLIFSTNQAEGGSSTHTEVLRIKNDGKVGIGTNAPADELHASCKW